MDLQGSAQGIKITDSVAENITRVEELAYELKVEEVMTAQIMTFSTTDSMNTVYETFRDARISGAPVVEDNQVIGVVSMEDLMKCLKEVDLDAPISKYMSRIPVIVRGSEPVVEALKLFVTTKHGRLPVVNDAGVLIGIITKGDVTSGLLKALQRSYQEEELRRYRASHLFEDINSDRTSLIMRYHIKHRDFTHGGTASSNIKRALVRLGANQQIARRCGIAAYEAEMNLIIHSLHGGVIRVEIEPHQITMRATDDGPGIKDINLAMKPGYSTASEEIRELGFGAGMGLVNISRCVDSMKLDSTWGKGTVLEMRIYLPVTQAGSETP